MARKSSVSRLPPEVKTYIEAMLATGAFFIAGLVILTGIERERVRRAGVGG